MLSNGRAGTGLPDHAHARGRYEVLSFVVAVDLLGSLFSAAVSAESDYGQVFSDAAKQLG